MSFKQITGFPGYEISDAGVVRSWLGRGRVKTNKQPHDVTLVWLPKPQRWAVRLNISGVRCLRCVANLVLETFVGPCPTSHQEVDFRDDDPANLNLSNLSWRNYE